MDKNKFSFSRVWKIVKLDWSSNKGFIITMLIIGLIIFLLPFILIGLSGSFADSQEAIYVNAIISMVTNIFFVVPLLSILWGTIVFRRANRNCPMHISLIPATAKEKYAAIFIEWIIKAITTLLLLSFVLLIAIVSSYFNDIKILPDIKSGLKEFYEFCKIMISNISGADDTLSILNILAILYIIFTSILSDFTVISAPCIIARKGWQVLLFIILLPFLSTVISSLILSPFNAIIDDRNLSVERINNVFTALLWSSMITGTLINGALFIIGYKKLKLKSNLN